MENLENHAKCEKTFVNPNGILCHTCMKITLSKQSIASEHTIINVNPRPIVHLATIEIDPVLILWN